MHFVKIFVIYNQSRDVFTRSYYGAILQSESLSHEVSSTRYLGRI